MAVAAVAGLVAGQIMIYLGVQGSLGQGPLQIFEQPLASKAVLGSAPASDWSRSASGMRDFASFFENLLQIHYGRPHTEILTIPSCRWALSIVVDS